MAYMPMFEPGNPTEAYEMFMAAAELSQRKNMPVFLRLTTHVCHAREVIKFGPLPAEARDWTSLYKPENGPYWPITSTVFPLKRRAFAKLETIQQELEASPFNQVWSPNGSAEVAGRKLGVITSAIPAYSVLECLANSDVPLDVLKLGITYPLPVEQLKQFLTEHDEVLLLEELDRVLEADIKMLAFDNGITTQIHTRSEIEHLMREFTPERTRDLLAEVWPEEFPPLPKRAAPEEEVSPRLAQMCPGCGHRSAFHAIAELLGEEYPDAITVADIGCHSLGSMEPYNMGTVLLCMGHSNGTGAGLAVNNPERPVITFIGDSTFYHAGLPGIINAIMHNHNITLVVMENYTTAMTGHQPTAGSGEFGDKISIPEVLEALGCKFIKSTDAYRQADLQDLMREAIAFDGFAVVIAKHPCMLKFLRDRQRRLAKKKQAEAVNR
jgi:indolepyruvate ferredoxin oxidoreductase alpha subunit